MLYALCFMLYAICYMLHAIRYMLFLYSIHVVGIFYIVRDVITCLLGGRHPQVVGHAGTILADMEQSDSSVGAQRCAAPHSQRLLVLRFRRALQCSSPACVDACLSVLECRMYAWLYA